MAILTRGEQIERWKVQSLIKQNQYTETYRAEDADHNPFFMKVFIVKRMPEKLMDADTHKVLEIEYCQKLRHKNIISYVDSGSFDSAEGDCQFYVTNYFTGELLAEKIQREGTLKEEEALAIFSRHADYAAADEMRRGMYLREFTALSALVQTS